MIVFDLKCVNGHIFEGWFEDSHTYDEQKEKSLISCPVCNDTEVFKIPSTFAIKSSSPSSEEIAVQQKEIDELAKKVWDYMGKNFEDVGCNFAKEALKIHYGAAEPRNIKGVSTDAEEKTLKEEGIEFFKIPVPKPPEQDTH